MIRFILNFIFFGVLFYAIAHFFPDTFERLVDWAERIYNFLIDAGAALVDWINEHTKSGAKSAPEQATTTLFTIQQLFGYFKSIF